MAIVLDGTTGISASGNITVDGTLSAGTLSLSSFSAIGNITGGNLVTAGVVSATGNITGNYFIGNGSQLTGIDATSIQNGSSNVRTYANGNVAVSVAGSANVVVFTTAGAIANGTVSVSGNVTGGNIDTGGVVTAIGNITGGNIVTAGIVTATGNITGNFFIGNGSQLTGIDATSIQNGTSNVKTYLNGNVAVSVAGTANVAVYDATGSSVTGNVSVSGNITGGNLATGGIVTATGNVNSGNINTAIVSATGAIIAAGNVTGGNLTTAGVVDSGSVTATTTVSAGGNVTGGNLTTAGVVTATGNITGGNLTTAGVVTATGNITGGNLTTGGALSVTGNADIGNINTAKVTATEVIGGGISLVGNTISSTDSTLTIDPATAGAPGLVVIAGNLSVQGTTTTYESTTVTINDLVFTVANNAATSAAANGGGIEVGPVGSPYATWLYDQPSSVWNTALGISATGNITAGNLSGTSIVGTLTTAAQTNITSVGTLSSLTVTGNVTAGNVSGTRGAFTDIAGTLETAAQTNITSVGTLASLDVTGNVTAGNLSGTNIVGTLTTAAQTNITSVGTLGSLSVTGNITGGNLITAGLVSLSSITKTGSNGVGNIGAAASTFDTVFAKATSAQYADVAEYYVADELYPVGTVLVFGGDQEVTQSCHNHSTDIAGVVSANPAVIMNSGLDHDNRVLVALLGRVLCRVQGPLHKGDRLVASDTPGVAVRLDPEQYQPGCMIGKALEDCVSKQETVIEVVVGRL